jgi:hypothetical protein
LDRAEIGALRRLFERGLSPVIDISLETRLVFNKFPRQRSS